MNQDYSLEDDYGRRTVFTGELLVDEHTDTPDSRKPQWVRVRVWRTEGGAFVVERTTSFRIRHARRNCARAGGYELFDAEAEDTFLCTECNKNGAPVGGYAQGDRVTVDVCHTPQDLIANFKADGERFSNLSRAVLADISNQDSRVDEVWNTVVVP